GGPAGESRLRAEDALVGRDRGPADRHGRGGQGASHVIVPAVGRGVYSVYTPVPGASRGTLSGLPRENVLHGGTVARWHAAPLTAARGAHPSLRERTHAF